MSTSENEPKIIIDEDWKTQVEREREALKTKQAEGGQKTSTASAAVGPTTEDVKQPSAVKSRNTNSSAEPELPPPPPASFPFLVSMLGTQALAALGQLGDGGDAPPPRLDYAKHYIDLLGLLESKTKGNLSTEEYDLLADWLHQLRMAYVQMSKHL